MRAWEENALFRLRLNRPTQAWLQTARVLTAVGIYPSMQPERMHKGTHGRRIVGQDLAHARPAKLPLQRFLYKQTRRVHTPGECEPDQNEPEVTPEREQAATPEDLTRLFVERANAGDADGLVALCEPEAVLAFPPGQTSRGHDAIRGLSSRWSA